MLTCLGLLLHQEIAHAVEYPFLLIHSNLQSALCRECRIRGVLHLNELVVKNTTDTGYSGFTVLHQYLNEIYN